MAVAAAHAVEHVGLPEARLNLAQATIYLARGAEVQQRLHRARRGPEDALGAEPVPLHLRDASYRGARSARARQGLPLPARRSRVTGRPALSPGGRIEDHRYYEPSGMGTTETEDRGTGPGSTRTEAERLPRRRRVG